MHCLSTIIHLNSPEETAKRQPRKLSSTTPDIKLSVKHRPSDILNQGQLDKRVRNELASKWGAKYQIEEGI